jgi:hypothetical protein
MRRPIFPLTALLLLALAAPAWPGGINATWNVCSSGPAMRTFACNSNVGTNDIVASFDPPQSLPDVTGAIGVIDLCLGGVNLAPWWQLGNGGCRLGALNAVALDVSGQPNCADVWQGQASASTSYIVGYSGWDSARILVFVGMGNQFAQPVEPGTEYHAFTVRIRNDDTVGGCAGCNYPACIVLNEIRLTTANSGDYVITNPLMSNYIQWQAYVQNCPFVVPVQNRTWGQVKTMYR